MRSVRKRRRKRPTRITPARLDRALGRVQRELHEHGLWTDPVMDVTVILVAGGHAYAEYGWITTGDAGKITVRALSTAMLIESRQGKSVPVADILRHEYGHALANIYKGLIRSRPFTSAFGASYDNDTRFDYGPDFHVTPYAATNASEDFAETFMLFLKYGGRLPEHLDTQLIHRKWRFIARFCGSIRNGRSRWDAA